MKMLMLLLLLGSTSILATPHPDCKQKLLDEYAKELDQLSQEEIIQRLKEIHDRQKADQEIDAQAKKLVSLLIQAGASSELKITDCSALKSLDDDPKKKALVSQLQEFCQESPQSFFAQIQPSGEIRFILKKNKATTKVFTVTLSGEVKLEYKGHELKLSGSFNRNQTGDKGNDNYAEDTIQKYYVDYAINTGIENLDAFIKLKQEMEHQETNAGDKSMAKSSVDLGFRPVIVDLENVRLDVGLGIGGSRRVIGGSLNPAGEVAYRPITTLSSEFSYKPVDWARTYIKLRLEQELSGDRHTSVSGTAGAEVTVYRGIAVAGEYGLSYDTARAAAGTPTLATTLTGNLAFSLDPRKWRGEDAQKELEARRAREAEIWRRAQKRLNQLP